VTLIFLLWSFNWGNLTHSTASIIPKPTSQRHNRIAIVTFITDQKSYIHLSLRNKDHYVKRHRYDLFVDYESHAERGTTWLKFDMIERLIQAKQHDWIWWMDFDTLITNTTMKLEDVISETLANSTKPDNIDFLVTDDCNGLNDGSFIVRSSPRSIEFLNRVRALHDSERKKENGLNDQEAMRDLLLNKAPLTEHVQRIPQWKINAFPPEITCFDDNRRVWEKGFFVIHFAGAWAHVDGDDPTGFLMKKYESEIIWGPEPEQTL
jgi:mannan polymerase II complex MNN10 subunit